MRQFVNPSIRQFLLLFRGHMRILPALERLSYRYPSVLVDAITLFEPGRRIVAVKNVTVNEEFFQGHFPGTPLMPGVLMIESLTQVASLLIFDGDTIGDGARLRLAAWRRQRQVPAAGGAGRSARARRHDGPEARQHRARDRGRVGGRPGGRRS